jgi:hypothetical protein
MNSAKFPSMDPSDHQQLSKWENDCLEQTDADLFGHGACHVLAVALKRSGKWAPCEIVRLPAVRDDLIIEAYHVYVRKGDEALDIKGMRKEMELLIELDQLLKLRGDKDFVSKINGPPQPVDGDALLEKDHRNKAGAWVNAWDQFSGDRFISEAMKRADSVIERWYAAALQDPEDVG